MTNDEDLLELLLANIGYKYIPTIEERKRIKGLFQKARQEGAAEQREKDAKIAETSILPRWDCGYSEYTWIAEAIRAQGEKLL